jgi:hypothetical protein
MKAFTLNIAIELAGTYHRSILYYATGDSHIQANYWIFRRVYRHIFFVTEHARSLILIQI